MSRPIYKGSTRRGICALCECGVRFETTKRKQVYCSRRCQYRERSITYRQRPDIWAPLVRDRREP